MKHDRTIGASGMRMRKKRGLAKVHYRDPIEYTNTPLHRSDRNDIVADIAVVHGRDEAPMTDAEFDELFAGVVAGLVRLALKTFQRDQIIAIIEKIEASKKKK